jgi:chloramphenicol-sensitive protein RarD
LLAETHNGRGMAVSVFASIGFGVLYYITPFAEPMSSTTLWAFRSLVATPVLFLVLLAMRETRLIVEVWLIMCEMPIKFLGMLAAGILLSLQMWVFMWAPLNGHGLGVALGYFLLPLVLVLQGRFIYKDQLRWWHWGAVIFAAVGVIFEIMYVGFIGWETLLVAIGYPPYFALRRAMKTESLGAMFWEQVVALPVAAFLVAWTATTTPLFTKHPGLWIIALAITTWGAICMAAYILASKLLPISVFGLLTYLEPAGLTVASLLIGETISPKEVPAYVAIWAAVITVLVGGVWQVLHYRLAIRRFSYAAAPATGSIPIQQNPVQQPTATGSIPIQRPAQTHTVTD